MRAVGERRALDARAVDVGAVAALPIDDPPGAIGDRLDPRVQPRDLAIVEPERPADLPDAANLSTAVPVSTAIGRRPALGACSVRSCHTRTRLPSSAAALIEVMVMLGWLWLVGHRVGAWAGHIFYTESIASRAR